MQAFLNRSRVLLFVLTAVFLAAALFAGAGRADNPRYSVNNQAVYLPFITVPGSPAGSGDWAMVAANPQRTSWSPEEVHGNLQLLWYRPIEAYISQNTQLIAAHGLIYAATARGLYALHAENGELAWRFDTELPLGNSPTVADGVVYVGGYDRKIHALNAVTGAYLWGFSGADAGFATNPLVIDGKVIAGNRDGAVYAIGAHNRPNQGQLIWKYQTDGGIHISPAYQNGVVYFAANDNYAYAVNANNGSLVWRSQPLPGDGYHSYWPVIYQDKVIFSTASGYRNGNPGLGAIAAPSGEPYGKLFDLERDELFGALPNGTLIGPTQPAQHWTNGRSVIDGARILQYHQAKPWRRAFVVLNLNNGSEYTFNYNGQPAYIPYVMWGTYTGNRYPPIVGPDDTLYAGNIYQKFQIPQGIVMGWRPGSNVLSIVGGQGAIDEPQALSAGGNLIYRNICCDRVGNYFDMRQGGIPPRQLWHYSNTLAQQAPGYDVMWYGVTPGDSVRLHGNYGSQNGIYHNHGDQNPIIPYQGRLFAHRSNAIVAYGPGPAVGAKPLLTAAAPQMPGDSLAQAELRQRLESEVSAILAAGHLRPGYYNNGTFLYGEFNDYFDNPGDTLHVLASAYPHLSPALRLETRNYLQNYFQTYFVNNMYARTGWRDGAPREAMPLPPEVEAVIDNFGPAFGPGSRWLWSYPQHNFYALWRYAQVVPGDSLTAYDLAKSKIHVPVPAVPPQEISETDFFMRWPWQLNAYIAGYVGFLELQEMAGMSSADAALRVQVTAELNRLLALRAQIFTKDTYWLTQRYHLRVFNVSRNFIFMTPELGTYLRQHRLNDVQAAVAEYNNTAPYWFVSRYNGVVNEGVMQNLYDYHAMFLAKAYILQEPRSELTKYLDVPAFAVGDLFYIQNLVAALNAGGAMANEPMSPDEAASSCRPERLFQPR